MVSEPTAVYYGDIAYWNTFNGVQRYQNRLATGDSEMFWYEHLLRRYGTFDRALILNCGNGWVERELVRIGLVREAVGIDISTALIAEAQRLASEVGAKITYQHIDINSGALPPGPFDLVINHSAAHHITMIDRVFRELCRTMHHDGLFVSWDYVGPHRNQYTAQQWEASWLANQELPPRFQQHMGYPHIPTMIAGDPSEAVHSELMMPTMRRYFRIESFQPLGGAIGYLVMTHNRSLYDAPLQEVEHFVERLIELDERFVMANPDQTLFAYIIARPNRAVLTDVAALNRWTDEENDREAAAAANGGVYYPRTLIAALVHSYAVPMHAYPARIVALHLASRIPLIGPLARRMRDALRGHPDQ
ncbi:MAG: class I SAM-dependent methyltransferase [Actinobacteria bacterium]|nr:class I SAM-dependent methyltransferase [Actinomycetota bacterium]